MKCVSISLTVLKPGEVEACPMPFPKISIHAFTVHVVVQSKEEIRSKGISITRI
jgi:hypothetical protein